MARQRSRPASFHRARLTGGDDLLHARSPPGRAGRISRCACAIASQTIGPSSASAAAAAKASRIAGTIASGADPAPCASRYRRTPRQVVVEDAGAPGSHTGNCISVAARPSVLAQEHRRVEPRRRSRRQPHRHQRDRRQDAGDRGRRPRIADVDAEQRAERRRQRRRCTARPMASPRAASVAASPITDRTIAPSRASASRSAISRR